MRKKIVYIGLGLIAVSIIFILLAVSSTSSAVHSLSQSVNATNITVAPGSFNSLKIVTPSNSFMLLISVLSGKANFYLFNSSAFSKWSAPSNLSGLSRAIALEGKGTFMIYKNATNATVPSTLFGKNNTAFYQRNQSIQYPAGTYYAVVDNTNGSASSRTTLAGRLAYVPPFNNSTFQGGALSGVDGNLRNGVLLGMVFLILFVAGLVVLIYGLMKKPADIEVQVVLPHAAGTGKMRANKQEMDKEYVDKLYKNVGKKKR